jgi:hypothetical protein
MLLLMRTLSAVPAGATASRNAGGGDHDDAAAGAAAAAVDAPVAAKVSAARGSLSSTFEREFNAMPGVAAGDAAPCAAAFLSPL